MVQISGGATPDYSEAIIGSNLFRRVGIAVDGPGKPIWDPPAVASGPFLT